MKEIEISGSQLELSQENKVDEEELSSQAAVAFRESTLKCVVSRFIVLFNEFFSNSVQLLTV